MARPPFPKKGKTADSKPAIGWYQDITNLADSTFTSISGTTGQIETSGDAPELNISLADDLTMPGTGGAHVPIGTTAERLSEATNGAIRYNSTDNDFEVYRNNEWVQFDNLAPKATVEQVVAGEDIDAYVNPHLLGHAPSTLKAWAIFNGTGTVAVTDSYNVESITDNGTGDYSLNLTLPINQSRVGVVATATVNASLPVGGADLIGASSQVRDSTTAAVLTGYFSTTTLADADLITAIVIGTPE